MDDLRRNKTSSGDKFSFPVIIPTGDDDRFESPNSPADHLFLNGKLLPHVFPLQTPNNYYSFSRSASRTSSIGSKDSLVSSRSNSTNSRSSSARTSTSEASSSSSSSFSERRLSSNRLSARKERNVIHRPVLGSQLYGSSQRWQLIAAAPVLKHQAGGSRSKVEILEPKMSRKSGPVEEDNGGAKTSWFGRRILKSFVSACKECHAITT